MDGIEGCGYGIFVFVIYELLLSRQLTIRYFNGIFRSGFTGARSDKAQQIEMQIVQIRKTGLILHLSLARKNSAIVPGPEWAPMTGST